ncbi:YqiA/YcfP family alpha/beta fold hydrolase [Suttonella ornithocola]|uniref:Predicted esterase of the alpha/beta hydrolase fold n=1 Tax=Suttonella ornithocola TaxID=279832 RepID=A0A380MY75_9GAMM|nr:YqiA/YcfP family alpha/beta fold hydrolase [Suttonella ornithocola]SUO97164.1 Predicted esterase of the alpha/beta hydrolase fold [Suttonella ornithocola]
MKVILSHGRGGSSKDKLIVYLRKTAENLGCKTHCVDDHDIQEEPDTRAQRLIDLIKQSDDSVATILVGFSMGGYASVLAAEQCLQVRGLFLIAPGLYLPRYNQRRYRNDFINTEIIHGWSDDIILYEHSLRFARENNAALHLLPDGHMLLSQLNRIKQLFTDYLTRIKEKY